MKERVTVTRAVPHTPRSDSTILHLSSTQDHRLALRIHNSSGLPRHRLGPSLLLQKTTDMEIVQIREKGKQKPVPKENDLFRWPRCRPKPPWFQVTLLSNSRWSSGRLGLSPLRLKHLSSNCLIPRISGLLCSYRFGSILCIKFGNLRDSDGLGCRVVGDMSGWH